MRISRWRGDENAEAFEEGTDDEDAVLSSESDVSSQRPNFVDHRSLPDISLSSESSPESSRFETPPLSPSALEATHFQTPSASEASSAKSQTKTPPSKSGSSKFTLRPSPLQYRFVSDAPEIKDYIGKKVRFDLPSETRIKETSSQKPPVPRPPQPQPSGVSLNTRSKTKARERVSKSPPDNSANSLKVKLKTHLPKTVRFKSQNTLKLKTKFR